MGTATKRNLRAPAGAEGYSRAGADTTTIPQGHRSNALANVERHGTPAFARRAAQLPVPDSLLLRQSASLKIAPKDLTRFGALGRFKHALTARSRSAVIRAR